MRVASHLAVGLLCLFLLEAPASAATIPSASDVDKLSLEAANTYSEFMQASARGRLQLELLGQTIDEATSKKLGEAAAKAVDHLADIAARQDALRGAIEDYQGADWDARYGTTGLWRRLKAEIARSQMLGCQARYWQARVTRGAEATKLLSGAMLETEKLSGEFGSSELRLLQARLLSVGSSEGERQRTMGILDDLCTDEKGTIKVEASLLRYRLNGFHDDAELRRIWEELKSTRDAGEELWMQVGFLGWSHGKQTWLEVVVQKWPADKELLAECILAQTEKRVASDGVRWMGPYAAGLAADAAADNPDAHRPIIVAMAAAKEYQGANLLYAMGLAVQKDEPLKAAGYLVQASTQMEAGRSADVAHMAASLAYQEFQKDRSCCKEAGVIVANYVKLAGEPEPAMLYFQYLLAAECGDPNETRHLLEKIAVGKPSQYQKAARHTLSVFQAQESLEAGKVVEAAALLSPTIDPNEPADVSLAVDIIAKFLDEWERYQAQDNGAAAMADCRMLANRCAGVTNTGDKSRLAPLALELRLLSNTDIDNPTELSGEGDAAARCRARLLMAKGQWQPAGEQWGRICEQLIALSTADARTWQWWRAKYYQLYCWSKGKDATKEELARRVSVTLSSCGAVPPLWEKKLRAMQGS
jgi:hypothetical protein